VLPRTPSPRLAESTGEGKSGRATIASELHYWLAIVSVLVVVLVGLEAGVRIVRSTSPGDVTERLQQVFLIALVVTVAGGLGLLVGGARPREILHFIYAIVALGALAVADSLSRRATPRRRATASLIGAFVALAVIARLFQTG
jgi:hypothetical protein